MDQRLFLFMSIRPRPDILGIFWTRMLQFAVMVEEANRHPLSLESLFLTTLAIGLLSLQSCMLYISESLGGKNVQENAFTQGRPSPTPGAMKHTSPPIFFMKQVTSWLTLSGRPCVHQITKFLRLNHHRNMLQIFASIICYLAIWLCFVSQIGTCCMQRTERAI